MDLGCDGWDSADQIDPVFYDAPVDRFTPYTSTTASIDYVSVADPYVQPFQETNFEVVRHFLIEAKFLKVSYAGAGISYA